MLKVLYVNRKRCPVTTPALPEGLAMVAHYFNEVMVVNGSGGVPASFKLFLGVVVGSCRIS